jgi:hypothetical protein
VRKKSSSVLGSRSFVFLMNLNYTRLSVSLWGRCNFLIIYLFLCVILRVCVCAHANVYILEKK